MSASSYITSSSRRWKTNIRPLTGALETVERMQGVRYDRKADGRHDIGLIAEEVGKVVPEVVTYEKNGVDAQGVDYSRLTTLLIEATKEQQALIRKLKAEGQGQLAEIKTQRAQIRRLTKEVQELQKSEQSIAGIEARLTRLEAGNKSNQTNAAARHITTKKQSAGSLVAKEQF